MEFWYPTYFNQNWYPNTFLVHKPSQIAHSLRHKREWNSIAKVGCNLTCLAMILGVDPAHLAGALAHKRQFFFPDPRTPAERLTKGRGNMVWDQNRPNEDFDRTTLRGLWHPERGNINVAIRFVESHFPENLKDAEIIIRALRARGHHAIWGTEKHANLVAGRKHAGYFLWDPDASIRTIPETAKGRLMLADRLPKRRTTEIYEYEIHRLPSVTPAQAGAGMTA